MGSFWVFERNLGYRVKIFDMASQWLFALHNFVAENKCVSSIKIFRFSNSEIKISNIFTNLPNEWFYGCSIYLLTILKGSIFLSA